MPAAFSSFRFSLMPESQDEPGRNGEHAGVGGRIMVLYRRFTDASFVQTRCEILLVEVCFFGIGSSGMLPCDQIRRIWSAIMDDVTDVCQLCRAGMVRACWYWWH